MKSKLFLIFSCLSIVVFSQITPLNRYISFMLKNHPKIQADRLKYNAMLAGIEEVGNLKDTQLSGGVFLHSPETRVGPQNFRLGARQELPWPGILKAQKEVVRASAEIQSENNDATIQQMIFKTKSMYYELAKFRQFILVLKENLALLNTYERLALSGLKNNLATMADVLKIRVKKNELNIEVKNEQSRLETRKRNFNRLLNRAVDDKIEIDSLKENVALPSILDVEEKIGRNPLINQFRKEREVIHQEILLNEKEGLPKIGLGLDYVLVSKLKTVNLKDNGKDVIMPMVSISIPLFDKKYKAKTERLKIQNEASLLGEQNEILALKKALDDFQNKFDISKRKIKMYKENIKESRRIQKLILTDYTTGRIDYDEILEVEEITLKYELYKINELNNLYQQKSMIEYLITSK